MSKQPARPDRKPLRLARLTLRQLGLTDDALAAAAGGIRTRTGSTAAFVNTKDC